MRENTVRKEGLKKENTKMYTSPPNLITLELGQI